MLTPDAPSSKPADAESGFAPGQGGGGDEGESGTFGALREPSFGLFLGGAFLSNVGTWLHGVAQGWLVFQLTGSGRWLGLVAFMSTLPSLLFTPLGGVLADRWNRRPALVVMQLLMLVSAGGMGLLVQLDLIRPWHIALLACLSGTALAFNGPSFSATIKDLTGPRDLASGVTLIGAQFHLSRALGPFLGAALLAQIGIAGAFYVNACSFVAVIVALMAMRPRYPQPLEPVKESLFASFRKGFAYVRSEPLTRWMMWVAAFFSLLTIPVMSLLPLLAKRVYLVDARGLAYLTGAGGVGAVLGSLSATVVISRLGVRNGTLVASAADALGLLLLGLTSSYHRAIALLVFVGWAGVVAATVGLTTVQATVPDRFRGRVMSLYNVAFMGSLTIGSLMVGELADVMGARRTICLLAIAFGVAVLGLWLLRPAPEAEPRGQRGSATAQTPP